MVKKSTLAFIALCFVVLLSRHVVNDLRQEERISTLENEVDELFRRLSTQKVDTIYSFSNHSNRKSVTRAKVAAPTTEKREAKDTLKFAIPILLDLNKVDSATLVRVPGIAARTAATIIRYREQLGGFVAPRQLEEKLTWDAALSRMDEWCTKWFYADTTLIIKLNVNQAEFKQILRHPYISYEQTKALVNYRTKYKKIEGFEALEMMEEFDETDIERLKPYLKF